MRQLKKTHKQTQVSAQSLVVGGRLCYLLASTWDFDVGKDLPRHPCLELRHHSVQGLTQILCRRLITMVKVKPYDPSLREHYLSVCRGDSDDRSQLPFSSLRQRTFEGPSSGLVTRRAWEQAAATGVEGSWSGDEGDLVRGSDRVDPTGTAGDREAGVQGQADRGGVSVDLPPAPGLNEHELGGGEERK
ncbi:unnamed protein product [Choristocarpus tenellus]